MKGSAAFWAKHFDAQNKSGLTVTKYCKSHGLAESQWYYRRKLTQKPDGQNNIKERSFLPFVIKPEPIIQPAHMALRIPGGIELVFDTHIDPKQLAMIVRHLKKEAL